MNNLISLNKISKTFSATKKVKVLLEQPIEFELPKAESSFLEKHGVKHYKLIKWNVSPSTRISAALGLEL